MIGGPKFLSGTFVLNYVLERISLVCDLVELEMSKISVCTSCRFQANRKDLYDPASDCYILIIRKVPNAIYIVPRVHD